MSLNSTKLNIMCVAAVVGALIAWLLGFDPMLGGFFLGATIYGFHNLAEDVLRQRVAAVDPPIIFDAIALATAAHNQDLNESLSLFVNPVQTHTIGVQVSSENELQDVDEWGRPDPVRFLPPAARYFPIRMAQTSIATNYVLSQKMTVQELNNRLDVMFQADAKWMRRRLLAGMFNNANYNFPDPQFGSIVISPIANGDAETYTRVGSGTAATDNHLKGSAALDNALMADVYAELVEHEENGGEDAQVVAFIPTSSVAAAKALPGFVPAPDPNMTLGTGQNQYVGSFAETAPGTPLGYDEDNRVHIREWTRLPDNYLIATTDAAIAALAMREDAEDSLRGFREIPGREDMPYLQRIWSRRAGFGAYNRVGVLVYRTNNVTYAIPSGYPSP